MATKMSLLAALIDKNVDPGTTPIQRRDGFADKITRDRDVARR
jgi:hypothetical protein